MTDLTLLVGAIRAAFDRSGRPRPRRPWPEPLPPDVDLSALLAAASGPDWDRSVPIALADDPEAQTQYPVGWRPRDGNLLAYGIGGSGTTTLLGTVAIALASRLGPDQLHLYILDFGAGELAPLAQLPHTGAVVSAGERERQMRLVRFVRSELERRRELGPAGRAGQPLVVILLDGYDGFTAEYKDVAGMAVADDFTRVFADGPEVGIHVVATGDRSASIPSAVSALVRQKVLLRLADSYDYGSFGVSGKGVPRFGPGGAVLAETGQVVQIARPADGLEAAVARLAAATRPATRPPVAVGQLPTGVSFSKLGAVAGLDTRPWRLPVGISERDLSPAALVAYEGEHALVAGPARSGKSTALSVIAAAVRAARPDAAVLAVAGPRSPLAATGTGTGIGHRVTRGGGGLAALLPPVLDGPGPVVVLVDDAEAVDDESNVLTNLVSSDDPRLLVVAAGRAEALRGLYSHWTRPLRRAKLGVLLRPNADLDGELLGVALPRRAPVVMTAGRGYLVNSGELEIVQLAHL